MIDIRVELSGEVDTYYSITTTNRLLDLVRRGETHSRVNKCVAAVTGSVKYMTPGSIWVEKNFEISVGPNWSQ